MNPDTPIIGFDAKRAVANGTGLGSYSRTLINDLARYPLTLRLYAPDEGRDDLRTQIQDRDNVNFAYPHSSLLVPRSSFPVPPSSKNHFGEATASSPTFSPMAYSSTTVSQANCPLASVRAAFPVSSPSTISSSSAIPNTTTG